MNSGNILKTVVITLCLTASAVCFAGSIHAAEKALTVYVAPDGSDKNNGSEKKPLKTIKKALDILRKQDKSGQKTIILRDGSYYETEIKLDERDSGLTIKAYPGENPVLYGGEAITDWEKDGDFLTAKMPGTKDRSRDFRLLVVDNEARPRARLPETGGFTHLSKTFRVRWLSTSGGGWEIEPSKKQLTTLKYNRKDIGPWLDLNNAELTTYGAWSASLVGLKSMDEATQTLTFTSPAAYPPGSFAHHRNIDHNISFWKRGQTYIIWNVREGMHRPGQWYLDRTNERLVYWPKAGESASGINAVVPTHETVIRIESGAENITLDSLTVSCAVTAFEQQWSATSVVAAGNVENCRIVNCTVENVEGSGISIGGTNNIIKHCEIRHMGKSGINLGGTKNTVSNNHIHHIGEIHYTFCIGISTGGSDNLISHNTIHDTAYTAVQVNGLRNVYELNDISSVMHQLNDGGCFYIGGTNNIIRRNYCHEGPGDREAWLGYFKRDEKRFNWAYYMDENATDCTFEENLAQNCVRPTHMHMTKGCTFRNNVFIDRELQILSFPRSSGLTFEKNILIADEIILSHSYDAFDAMPNNIYFSRLGVVTYEKTMVYTLIDYLPYKATDGSVFADPLFVDPDNRDFRFKSGSPAEKLGIKSIDVRTAGVMK